MRYVSKLSQWFVQFGKWTVIGQICRSLSVQCEMQIVQIATQFLFCSGMHEFRRIKKVVYNNVIFDNSKRSERLILDFRDL